MNRGILSVPDGVSNQLECPYRLAALLLPFSYQGLLVLIFWKSIPAASHGEYLFPPSAPNLFIILFQTYRCLLSHPFHTLLFSFPAFILLLTISATR